MLIRREFERRGDPSLVQTQIIGIDGQIERMTYQITGPRPGRFRDLASALAWFNDSAAASKTGQTASICVAMH